VSFRLNSFLRAVGGAAFIISTGAAHAECPLELAVYQSADGKAGIDFTPNHNAGATVTNSFKLVLGDRLATGMVQWTSGAPRPLGAVLLDCPEGDATGEEIAACTLWQGVIYAVEADGTVGLLPAQGKPAPKRLIFSTLGVYLQDATKLKGMPLPDTDVFELSGCQE
jgi:hypothetical protein